MIIKTRGDFKLDESNKEYARFKKRIPRVIAVNSVQHFKKGFSKGGKQTDGSKSGWTKRQYRKGGNTLVKTSTLQRDIQVKRASFKKIVVGTSNLTSKYAEIHNKGGVIKITSEMRRFFWSQFYKTKDNYWKNMALHKSSTITIPKREYIGHSNKLDKKNMLSLGKGLKKVFDV